MAAEGGGAAGFGAAGFGAGANVAALPEGALGNGPDALRLPNTTHRLQTYALRNF
jgi:hypothetical protein